MTVLLANNVSSALAAPITAAATSMTVTNGSRFPVLTAGQYFYATIIATSGIVEIVKVITRTGNAMAITRAQDGTNAQAFSSGARVEMRINAASVKETVTDQTGPLDTRLTTAEGDITALEGRMTTAEGDIVVLEAFDAALISTSSSAQGDALVGFRQSTGTNFSTGAVARTVNNKLQEYVSVKDFGATGDGVTDDTAAIQAAINFAIYGFAGNFITNATSATPSQIIVRFPRGNYKITDTLQVGYGTSFTTAILEGETDQFYTGISTTFNDRPCIAVQGVRRAILRGLSLIGVNEAYMQTRPWTDRADVNQYVGPNLGATSLARYAPYAGIAIDPYSGTRPATSYPDVTYPAFLGTVAQYNKNFSNVVLIEDCRITGFAVGVVTQPCDADGNGDFVSLSNVSLVNNIYGFANGNSQARLNNRINVDFSDCYTCIDNKTFGRQVGNSSGLVSGCCFDRCYQIFNISLSFTDPINVDSCYAEVLYRIGDVSTVSITNYPIRFTSCAFIFGLYGSNEYTPNSLMSRLESGLVLFDSCNISTSGDTNSAPYMMVAGSGRVVMNNCWVNNRTLFDETTISGKIAKTFSLGIWDDYQALRRNLTAGIIRNPDLYNFAGTAYTSETTRSIDCSFVDILDFNNMPIPLWTQQIGSRGFGVPYEFGVTTLSGGITNIVQTGREYACRFTTSFSYSGLVKPGSIAVFPSRNQLFYIKSVSNFNTTFFDAELVQLTNLKLVAGVWSVKAGSELVSGAMYVYNAAKFYPSTEPVYADVTSGSADITMRLCGSNTANATALGVLAANDAWDGGGDFGRAGGSRKATAFSASVNSVTSGTGVATMSSVARLTGAFDYPIFIKGTY